MRVGRVLGRSKVAKHFRYEITDDAFTFERNEHSIAEEAALDGIYVIRTSVAKEELDAEAVVSAYKDLAAVEQAFRVLKGFALEVGPIRHRLEKRVRAHVFLCMLALYVRKHMERALAPLLLTDHDPDGAKARRVSVVAPARRSEAGERKVRLQRTDDDDPARSFDTLLADLRRSARTRRASKAPRPPSTSTPNPRPFRRRPSACSESLTACSQYVVPGQLRQTAQPRQER